MTFKDTFCSSPWIHARINNNGDYEYCRWTAPYITGLKQNISQIHPTTWFQQNMSTIRRDMLDGKKIPGCDRCAVMEKHGKVSGRQKQLLKTGVVLEYFEKTMLSSPWVSEWRECHDRDGKTDMHVQDWQIDLGNFCNNSCLFCSPQSSSRLASEHYQLGLISKMPPAPWCDDPLLLDRFIDALKQSPHIQYLHFIGGETIITPAFRKILKTLIDVGISKKITIGFTTNLTVMDQEIVDLLTQFHLVNLGLSVECLDPANDYIRYGSRSEQTKLLLDRWVSIGKERQWLIQIRTTPTVLSISRLTTVYDYAWENRVAIESCNFIDQPAFMRPAVLPIEYRSKIRNDLQVWAAQKDHLETEQIVNIRHPDLVQQQIIQDIQSYIRYLDSEPDQSDLLPELVRYLKVMESSRKNSVLDYLPEYEELFRSIGY